MAGMSRRRSTSIGGAMVEVRREVRPHAMDLDITIIVTDVGPRL